ncbi:glycosyltransferase [Nocardioides sp. TRM66260-LWL]|uniref:glycosyltransferase n=1 Tax=Nocardioides sp. TRM66260-LWL TaxID=2874478 RepID=UPI001CC5D6AA|nr:glycosyltransferase [Nocardioides sp. TRM66260-LWL]MBZ5734934.1 glycosyltransferase [Nocardioides sp. TRM66260-LWL]
MSAAASDGSVAVAIIHFHHFPDVLDTIASALEQGVDPGMVCVIDNGSDDGFGAAVAGRFPGVTVVEKHENLGYAHAVNAGAAWATAQGAKRLLVMTHEVRLAPSALSLLTDGLARGSDRGVAATAPLVLRRSTQEVWSAGGDLDGQLMPVARSAFRDEPPSWVDGCCFLVDLAAFRAIGGMHEGFFLYMEEIDFFLRLADSGRSVAVIPEAGAEQEPGGMSLYFSVRNRVLLARRRGRPMLAARVAAEHALKAVVEAGLRKRSPLLRRQRLLGALHGVSAKRDGSAVLTGTSVRRIGAGR